MLTPARGPAVEKVGGEGSLAYPYGMDDLVNTVEMYLKAVLELEEENIVPLRARISERLEQSGPTVSQTVARMERDGLVVVSTERHVELTPLGRQRAMSVMRKHRLAETFLSDVVGLDWEQIHDEACRLEHVMSDRVENRLMELLKEPSRSPYGNPIPRPEEIREPDLPNDIVNLMMLVAGRDVVHAKVRWIGEPLQVDHVLLKQLRQTGLLPGSSGAFTSHGPGVIARMDGSDQELELPHEFAAHIFVTEKSRRPLSV
jgi:DtxR family Mn-dependent transcriptional regulator